MLRKGTSMLVVRLPLALLLVGSASQALAVNGNWVLDGSTVSYNGITQTASLYALRVGKGDVVINNNPLPLGAALVDVGAPTFAPSANIFWATSGACAANANSLLAIDKPYYVYYGYSVLANPFLMVTSVAPNEEGTPSAPLFVKGQGICGTGFTTAVFLGSFISADTGVLGLAAAGTAVIVPFERTGDHVNLLNAGVSPAVSFQWTNVTGSVKIQTNLAGLTPPWVWPTTAAALSVRASFTNLDAIAHAVQFLDENFIVGPVAGLCNAGNPYQNLINYFSLPAGGSGSSYYDWSPSVTGAATMSLALCDAMAPAAGHPVTTNILYRGYTEMIHHLDRIR